MATVYTLDADNQRGGAGVVNPAEWKRTDTLMLPPKGLSRGNDTSQCFQINLLPPATVVALRPAPRHGGQSYFGKVGGEIGRTLRMQ